MPLEPPQVGNYNMGLQCRFVIRITRDHHSIVSWPRGYKTFFMLNSIEHDFFSARKFKDANNCWHFSIYEQEKSILGLSEPEKCCIS